MNILYVAPLLADGGVEKMMYEWISHFNKEVFHVDIVVNRIISKKQENVFKQLGCDIFELPYTQIQLQKKVPELMTILSKNKYDIIHVHSCFAFDFWILAIAKKMGISCRIIHSHNAMRFAKKSTYLLDKLSKPLLRHYATDFWGCSDKALHSLCGYNRKVLNNKKLIHNGINISKFKFDSEKKKKLQEQYNLEHKTVVGTVGRLSYQKNQKFLIDVFYEIHKLVPDTILILIGDGELRIELEKQVKTLNLQDSVIFTGTIENVEDWYQMIDIFLLTSYYEGLAISGIEAQCAGLKCVFSSSISQEIAITNLITFLSLDEAPSLWAKVVIQNMKYERMIQDLNIKYAGYDIENVVQDMENTYLEKRK